MQSAKAKSKGNGKGAPSFKRSLKRIVLWALAGVIALPVVLSVLYTVVNPISTLMLARYLTGQPVTREFVPLEKISTNLQRAVVVSEDSLFCQHDGIDWKATHQQVAQLFKGERPRGASTISMQLAKNLFLWNGRNFVRKALEAPLAILLDTVLGKRRVLEIYLNVVEWGDGVFGAEAAAKKYFGRSAEKLSKTQASLLATALPNPLVRNAAKPSSGHRRLAGINRSRTQVAGDVLSCTLP
ncbi:monofunctional biosynthetic peptidoglycan transglycosylase [Rhodobacteraceae bacterium RKSG542]|nr:monofunctional biosynthetic peptidoglycan transglycosylase [Pseudovibrio flavus]